MPDAAGCTCIDTSRLLECHRKSRSAAWHPALPEPRSQSRDWLEIHRRCKGFALLEVLQKGTKAIRRERLSPVKAHEDTQLGVRSRLRWICFVLRDPGHSYLTSLAIHMNHVSWIVRVDR